MSFPLGMVWDGFSGGFGLFLGWVSQWVLIDFELGFPVGLSWFWVGSSNCFSVDFGIYFCARLVFGGGAGFAGYFLLPSYSAALVCCSLIEEREKKN